MARLNHINLAVAPGQIDVEVAFLRDILHLERVDPGEELTKIGSCWFEAEGGTQIHLSQEPDFRPSVKAHVALDYDGELAAVKGRLAAAGIEYHHLTQIEPLVDSAIVVCDDPAGNHWELRGPLGS